MEVWDAKHRPILAGLIGAASNVGFVIVGVMGALIKVNESNWKWFAILGAAPALLTFFIRLFVPESHKWKASQEIAKSRPLTEIFTDPKIARTALIAIAFASVALIGTWGAVQKIPTWVSFLPGKTGSAVGNSQIASGVGAIVGCLIAPLIAAALNRRLAYVILCVSSLAACQFLFWHFKSYSVSFLVTTFVVGGTTAAMYGLLPLYLPELFPTRVRATAQGIAYNFGRILAGAGAIWGGTIGGNYARMGQIVSLVYIIGIVIIWLSPETKGKPLPE
jgi:MFS family permease